jgi:CspA family cold shock protein
MQPNTLGREVIEGTVKWFDPGRGFGFVVADTGGADILLHANVLRNFGQSSVADSARVEIVAQTTPRGRQAVEVLAISPPDETAPAPLDDMAALDPDELASLPLEPSRVKWFDKAKGYGFANVFGRSEDVFIHVEVLRRSGLADLQPGEAVALKVVEGRRGRMATHVAAWERAIREPE